MSSKGIGAALRPASRTGRPVSGFVRPGTQAMRPGTVEAAVKAPRTATARPLTSASGRHVRLGTASMLSAEPGVFIDLGKLDLRKYARRPALAKALFGYILHVANDTVRALDLASHATEACDYEDWWWKAMLGLCYFRLGMQREAEQQLRSSIKSQPMAFTHHLLAKVHLRLDQPLNAIECYEQGLAAFPGDASLLAGVARVHEAVGNLATSVAAYRRVLQCDATNVEAIASLAADRFYADQPEHALQLYRRLLQAGLQSPELFNNLALCCFYAQQYDMAFSAFERALALAADAELAEVWYNISHVAVGLGDVGLCFQCLKLAVTHDPTHAEAFNNLGVLEHRKGNVAQARASYQTAMAHGPGCYEPHYNKALLCDAAGNHHGTFRAATKAAALFPGHAGSRRLVAKVQAAFAAL